MISRFGLLARPVLDQFIAQRCQAFGPFLRGKITRGFGWVNHGEYWVNHGLMMVYIGLQLDNHNG